MASQKGLISSNCFLESPGIDSHVYFMFLTPTPLHQAFGSISKLTAQWPLAIGERVSDNKTPWLRFIVVVSPVFVCLDV